jgi:hypothetical protein
VTSNIAVLQNKIEELEEGKCFHLLVDDFQGRELEF